MAVIPIVLGTIGVASAVRSPLTCESQIAPVDRLDRTVLAQQTGNTTATTDFDVREADVVEAASHASDAVLGQMGSAQDALISQHVLQICGVGRCEHQHPPQSQKPEKFTQCRENGMRRQMLDELPGYNRVITFTRQLNGFSKRTNRE